jgi:hypothetical protein
MLPSINMSRFAQAVAGQRKWPRLHSPCAGKRGNGALAVGRAIISSPILPTKMAKSSGMLASL